MLLKCSLSLPFLTFQRTESSIHVIRLKDVYQGYILLFIDYGSPTWGSAASTHIERLSKLQKRAARIILHAEFNTPSDTMFRELGWVSVPNRIIYNKAVFT